MELSSANTEITSRTKLKQIYAGLVGSLNGLMWGVIVGYTSPAINSFEEDGYTPYPMDDDLKSLMASLPSIGSLLGNLISGPMTAKFGRKRVFQLAMAPQIASWVLLGFSSHPAMLMAARFIQGASADAWGPISQLYTAEIASIELRDTLGGFVMFELALGLFMSYAIGGLLRWDYMAFAIAGAMAILGPTTFFIPESPVYLVSKNQDEEAKKALEWLRGSKNSGAVEQELLILQNQRDLERKRTNGVSLKTSLKKLIEPRFMKPFSLIVLLMTLRQWTGIFAVFSFAANLFKMAGAGSIGPHESSMILGAIQIVSQCVSAAAVEKFGKKPLAVSSSIVMAVGLFGIGVFFYINTLVQTPSSYAVLPLICTSVVLIGFDLGLASFPFVLVGELLPDGIRDHAAGVCFLVNGVSSVFVLSMFHRLIRWCGVHGVFWVYSGAATISAVSIGLFAPNTKGRSLAELQSQFDEKKSTNN